MRPLQRHHDHDGRIVERRKPDKRTVVVMRIVLGGHVVDLHGYPRVRVSFQARLETPVPPQPLRPPSFAGIRIITVSGLITRAGSGTGTCLQPFFRTSRAPTGGPVGQKKSIACANCRAVTETSCRTRKAAKSLFPTSLNCAGGRAIPPAAGIFRFLPNQTPLEQLHAIAARGQASSRSAMPPPTIATTVCRGEHS